MSVELQLTPPSTRRLALVRRIRDLFRQFHHGPSHLGVPYAREGPDQPHRARRLEKTEADIDGVGVAAVLRRVGPRIEERDRHTQRRRDPLQPAGRDAIGALLVFLDLLERDAELLAELGLRQPALQPEGANALADLGVPGVAAALVHRDFSNAIHYFSHLSRDRQGCDAAVHVDGPGHPSPERLAQEIHDAHPFCLHCLFLGCTSKDARDDIANIPFRLASTHENAAQDLLHFVSSPSFARQTAMRDRSDISKSPNIRFRLRKLPASTDTGAPSVDQAESGTRYSYD